MKYLHLKYAALFVLLLLVPPGVFAQQDDEPPETLDVEPGIGILGDSNEAEELFEEDFSGYSDQDLAFRLYQLVESGRFARARVVIDELLTRDPKSIPAHLMLGIVYYLSDGNLPRAFYHVKKSRQLIEDAYGEVPFDDDMIYLHATAISEMAEISGAMGRHEDKIRYLLERDSIYDPPMPAQLGWPLMRLRRYDEARAAVDEALSLVDRPDQLAIARTALCAIEAEQQNRDASWEACRLAAEHERRAARGGPTPFTNAAEAALGVLKFDEAERLILEGTKRRPRGTVSNPWLDLTLLYLAQGRISEALDSVRQMFKWRRSQPAHIDEQNRAETELTSAVFLIAAGHAVEASGLTERILDRPDRTGYTSSETEQMEAANALADSVAQRVAAEVALERASYSPFWDAMKARLEAGRRRSRAWSSGRRMASLVAAERILLATLRPYLAGSVEIPEWLEPDMVEHLGPGVVQAAVKRARERETVPEAEGYFLSFESEVAWHQGRWRRALERAEQAIETLPGSEQMLRARLSARGAQAAKRAGEPQRALELFDQAMQLDPGVIRRLSLALPVSFDTPDGWLARETVDLLKKSPRLTETGRGWFRVQVGGDGSRGFACLFGPQGTRFACAEVQLQRRAGDEGDEMPRRLAKQFHEEVFAARIDLTQADLRSLDGSPTAGGGRSSERLRSVLSDMVGDGGDGGDGE